MNEYSENKLKKYIEQSELLVVNESLKVRLSKGLLEKYKNGYYNSSFLQIADYVKKIGDLGLIYPANAKPVFYVYIVPDENFHELLNFPSSWGNDGGGTVVGSYDLEGFNMAYGVTNNILENKMDMNIMQKVNSIHEFAHLVHSMFFQRDRFLAEGFAESLPLYTMDYESTFDEHREMLGELAAEQILSAQELIELSNSNSFDAEAILPNKSCAFDLSYISSYLFVRGCMEIIEKRNNMNRVESTQEFLEIVKRSECSKQWLVFDIANEIGVPEEELLNGKEMQIKLIDRLTQKENLIR